MAPSGSLAPSWARVLRKGAIALAGSVVLAVGLAMVVLPGPALIVIPAGLAILATEFAWARRALRRVRRAARRVFKRGHSKADAPR